MTVFTPFVAAQIIGDWGWHSGHMDGSGWWMALMMLLWVVLIVVVTVLTVRALARRNTSGKREAPLEILDRQLAKGKISVTEYHERRAILDKSAGENND